MEATQMTMNRWMDTQIVMYSYSKVLFGYKRNEEHEKSLRNAS